MSTQATSQAAVAPRPSMRGTLTLQSIALFIGRIGLAYLFFTQLFWKLPPTFGCPSDYAFTTGTIENGRVSLQRTSGLCDWIGIESVWAQQPRPFFVTNIDNRGGPEISVDLGWAARLNGFFLDSVVKPNIRWFGYLIWGSEAFIFLSLLVGLFSRLGGLVALGVSSQLMIGLGGISTPFEWEWSYNLMVLLSLIMFAFAPGRFFGVDVWLRPKLLDASKAGNRLSKALLWLT